MSQIMGRMHTHRHGKSHSIRPATLRAPSWITLGPKEIEELVIKYSKDGLTPSQIGIKLRDQHSIPLIKPITKKTIGEILEENDLVEMKIRQRLLLIMQGCHSRRGGIHLHHV